MPSIQAIVSGHGMVPSRHGIGGPSHNYGPLFGPSIPTMKQMQLGTVGAPSLKTVQKGTNQENIYSHRVLAAAEKMPRVGPSG